MEITRRTFIKQAGLVSAVLLSSGFKLNTTAWAAGGNKEKPVEEVTPAEDLMREHGALERLLLIYEEAGRRLASKTELRPEILLTAARLNRDFVENYHEKLEENYLFPGLTKAGKQVELVKTLLAQHQAGRHLTDTILRYANLASLKHPDDKQALITALSQYIRMYRPHASREDTVLFPAFKTVVSTHEYDALGEQFENEERRLFGQEGFETVIGEIAELEKQLGIHDLSQFTPSV